MGADEGAVVSEAVQRSLDEWLGLDADASSSGSSKSDSDSDRCSGEKEETDKKGAGVASACSATMCGGDGGGGGGWLCWMGVALGFNRELRWYLPEPRALRSDYIAILPTTSNSALRPEALHQVVAALGKVLQDLQRFVQ